MIKNIKYITLCIAAMILFESVFTQVTVSGPTCVMPGVTYQYNINGNWSATSTMQACVNGGTIIENGQASSNHCSPNAKPVSSLFVIWNQTASGSLTITSSQGNTSLNIVITSVLQPGILNTETSQQSFADTTSTPVSILCSASSGGSCTANYSYQWQRSNDALVWSDISGSTGQNLSFSSPVKQTTFYRRKVTETSSGTIDYSSTATVNIIIQIAQIKIQIRKALESFKTYRYLIAVKSKDKNLRYA